MKTKEERGRKDGTIVFNSRSYHVLKITAAGAAGGILFAAFLFAPNALQIVKPLRKYLENYEESEWKDEQKRLRRAVELLRSRRLVELITKGGQDYLKISTAGQGLLKQFDIESLKIQEPEKWDRKWRLVLFDIPETYKRGRNALRGKLIELGFYQLQKSAFIYPYHCQDEIDFVSEFFQVSHHVQYVTCEDLGKGEALVRKHFGLL